jgi:hypothetical protein
MSGRDPAGVNAGAMITSADRGVDRRVRVHTSGVEPDVRCRPCGIRASRIAVENAVTRGRRIYV